MVVRCSMVLVRANSCLLKATNYVIAHVAADSCLRPAASVPGRSYHSVPPHSIPGPANHARVEFPEPWEAEELSLRLNIFGSKVSRYTPGPRLSWVDRVSRIVQ